MNKEIVAMVLAGGRGSRLGKITNEIAKPAVPFGGKYRIIDFALSNCTNSGIMNVGVVTQYQPQILNEHVGNGAPWGLNRHQGGATILQPYTSTDGEKWFEGTAHSIYQNINYIDRYNPDHVLILSGDHIYKMDYGKMLRFHKEKNAKLTVGVLPVGWDEASRFGIMNTDETDAIIEFEEKPKEPKSNLASMGIYIFDWPTLRQYFMDDKDNELMDFGHDVIPAYLKNDESVYAYSFTGYWKDVGTVESLWEANMEFIDPIHELKIRDTDWVIYTRIPTTLPQRISENAVIENSILADGVVVRGAVHHSVVSYNSVIEEGAVVKDSVIMPGATIGKGARLENIIVGESMIVEADSRFLGEEENIQILGYEGEVGGDPYEK